MKTVSICLVLLSPAFASAGDAFPKLKLFAPKGAGFSLQMPDEPKENKSSVDLTVGNKKIGAIEITTYSAESDGLRFDLVVSRYPAAALALAGSTPDKLLANRAQIETASGGKVISDKKITLGKYPGRDILREQEGGKESVRVRIIQAGGQQFVLSLSGPKALVNSKDAGTFMGSLKVTK